MSIRFEISRHFAQAKAKVIMINRKEDQGNEAIEQIRQETPDADVDWGGCDLGSLKEVQIFSVTFVGSLTDWTWYGNMDNTCCIGTKRFAANKYPVARSRNPK